jgi:hypothetical protein
MHNFNTNTKHDKISSPINLGLLRVGGINILWISFFLGSMGEVYCRVDGSAFSQEMDDMRMSQDGTSLVNFRFGMVFFFGLGDGIHLIQTWAMSKTMRG